MPLLDAQRAIRITRAKAAEWKIDPQRIGILGFSAGGHVASTAGTHFDAGRAGDADPIERVSCRPDFMLLVYPVVTMGEKTHELSKTKLLGANPKPELVRLFSNETQVTDQTPPAFLAHARDDTDVPPDNSRNFVAAMKAHHVPVEYLELPSGGHGFNGCKGPLWEEWKAKSLAWLASRGFIPLKAPWKTDLLSLWLVEQPAIRKAVEFAPWLATPPLPRDQAAKLVRPSAMSRIVRQWNDRWAYPRLVVATTP